ncbi:MAG: hypothetical protein LQ352_004167 [Teloschistes flavicans]|nr:MAG: hypothetical protein LQ352_004167 [Teloschistes flavicans]
MSHNGPNDSQPSAATTPCQRFARSQPTQAHEEAHPNDLPPSREVYVPPHRNLLSQVTSYPLGPRTPPGAHSTHVPPWRTRRSSEAVSHHPLDTSSGSRSPVPLPEEGGRPQEIDGPRSPSPSRDIYIPPWRAHESSSFQALNILPDQERWRHSSPPPEPRQSAFSEDLAGSSFHGQRSNSSEDTRVSRGSEHDLQSRASVVSLDSRPIDLLNRPGPISTPGFGSPPAIPPAKDSTHNISLTAIDHSSSSSPSPPASPRPTFKKLKSPTPSGDSTNRSASPRSCLKKITSPSPCGSRVLHGRIQRPRLSIRTPRMMPVKPYNRPPPNYDEWHPTTIVVEYQIRRGLGFSEPVYKLCNFLNRGEAYKSHKMIVEEIEARVVWLLRYWDDMTLQRMIRYERERVEWRRDVQGTGRDALSKAVQSGWNQWWGEDEEKVEPLEDEEKVEPLEDEKKVEPLEEAEEEEPVKKDKVKKQVQFKEPLEEYEPVKEGKGKEKAPLDAPSQEDKDTEMPGYDTEDDRVIAQWIQDNWEENFEDDSPSESSKRARVEGERPTIPEDSSTDAAEGADTKAKDEAITETKGGWEQVFKAFGGIGWRY